MHFKTILASAAAVAMTAFTLAPAARAQTFINSGEVTGASNVGGIFGKVESPPPCCVNGFGGVEDTVYINLAATPNYTLVTGLGPNYNVSTDMANARRDRIYLKKLKASCQICGFKMGTPPGEFSNGALNEDVVGVDLTSPFYIGVLPITRYQYQKVLGLSATNPDWAATSKDVNCTWNSVRGANTDPQISGGYLSGSWLHTLQGKMVSGVPFKFDLPTEAQWEYACRAGTTGQFSDGLGAVSTTIAELKTRMEPLGFYVDHPLNQGIPEMGNWNPNPAGLFDLHGCVHEWCRDVGDSRTANGYGTPSPVTGRYVDPVRGNAGTANKVWRGGCYATQVWNCRSAFRLTGDPSGGSPTTGFRLAANPNP